MPFKSRADRLLGWLFGGALAIVFASVVGHILVRILSEEPPGPGDVAPAFSLSSPVDGGRVATADLKGMVLLLDFWETTCVGCVGATPKLNRLHDKYADRGFMVIGVNREPDHQARVRAFAEKRGLRYPIATDPGHVSRAYGIYATPTVILIGADGRIRTKHMGPVTEERLAEEIEAALEDARKPAEMASR